MREGRARFILVSVVWVTLLTVGFAWFLSRRPVRIAIAGGPANSETFELASAISTVLRDAVPNLRVDVYETGGSNENVRLIEEGRVDLATVQADTKVSDRVQGVVSLYHDAYQLIVHEGSGIVGFEDLAGHRVAIAPTNSGQNRSFWFVAEHFGVRPDDLTALPMSEDAANFAMIHGQVDAVFRVRTPGNPAIRDLVGTHSFRIVPIPQSAALGLQHPSISSGVIPIGSYRGHPPVPPRDLPTAVLERLLVARAGLDAAVVQNVTRILFEWRANLVAESKLAGFIRPLGSGDALSFPIHAGARRYYDREKPGFVKENARTLSGLLYVVAILTSAGFALRARLLRAKRVRMGDYNLRLMDIAEHARRSASPEELQGLKDRLIDMLRQVVQDLDQDKVTQDEFEHFSFTWQAVDTLVRDRLVLQPVYRESAPSEVPAADVEGGR